MTNANPNTASTTTEQASVPLLEEVAQVGVHPVETGRVRVTTRTETFEEIARAELHGEAVEVTRVAVNQPITGALPTPRREGDVTIVPVFEEVLVVEKRLMLKEELHIRKRSTVEEVALPVTLRQQTASVERLDASGSQAPEEA